MEISQEDLQKLGRLSNLNFTKEELEKITIQIREILNFVGQLNQVKENQNIPLTHITNLKNISREDEVKPSLTQEQALRNAPDSYKGYFRVKAIFKDET